MAVRIVFMGTPDFAVPSLQALLAAPDFEVVGVVTQPDREAGRGRNIQFSPVKICAQQYNLPIFQPEKLRGDEVIRNLASWKAGFFIVAAYGQILRQAVLDLPRFGCINVHASLLPRWRGAAPIQAAILAGDAETGITIMQMDAGLDTGGMYRQYAVKIDPDETGQSLHDKLATLGGTLLVETLRDILSTGLQPQPQDESLSTYAPRISKEDGHIQWTQTATLIDRRVRAFTPWPGTFSFLEGKLLKIHAGKTLSDNPSGLVPGQLSTHQKSAPLVIGTGGGSYAPIRLQLEGRKVMEVGDFVNGLPDLHGKQLS